MSVPSRRQDNCFSRMCLPQLTKRSVTTMTSTSSTTGASKMAIDVAKLATVPSRISACSPKIRLERL